MLRLSSARTVNDCHCYKRLALVRVRVDSSSFTDTITVNVRLASEIFLSSLRSGF
jgi:hypothetical protein